MHRNATPDAFRCGIGVRKTSHRCRREWLCPDPP
jgi:hypothetical protein